MTRRRDRAIARRRPPAVPGGFASDEAVAETLGRIPDWDGTTITFGGASGTIPAAIQDTGPVIRFGAGRPAAILPPAPAPPPSRPADCAMPARLRDGTFGLLCGIDLWRIHFDPEAAWYDRMFDALRVSALRAGWRPDAWGRWCCPRCVMDPAYATPKPLAHWHPAVPHARPRDTPLPSWEFWLARPATEYHRDAADAAADGDPAAEFWFQEQAVADVAGRTADAGRHGRHEAGAR